MEKFSPGPWQVDTTPKTDIAVVTTDWTVIARIRRTPQAAAHARLVAAAPDLFYLVANILANLEDDGSLPAVVGRSTRREIQTVIGHVLEGQDEGSK